MFIGRFFRSFVYRGLLAPRLSMVGSINCNLRSFGDLRRCTVSMAKVERFSLREGLESKG